MKTLMIGMTLFAAASAFAGPFDKAWIKGVTDKNPLEYKPGEKMVFTLTPQKVDGAIPAGCQLAWKRTGDDGLVEEGKAPLDGKPFVYSTSIKCPGFVRLQAHVVGPDGSKDVREFPNDGKWHDRTVVFDGGAGVEIDKLKMHPEPADFDEFWARQFKRLDLVPIKADLVELPMVHAPKARRYAVRIDCAGLRPVTGYLRVPKAVDEGKTFPARLETHGYSGAGCTHGPNEWGSDNEIILNINAHGLKLEAFGATEADTKALRWEISPPGTTYAFDARQNADPETAYFNGMVLRVKRALQYLKTVKGWNGKDLIASGASQGGLQTIWAAACGEGVTRAESEVTWCCDLYTSGKLRLDKSLNLAADGWYIPWTDALGYYDAVNFAKRIPKTCKTNITRAGLGDYCCPPTGLAKLWNNIPGPKKIHWMQGTQHSFTPPQYEGREFTYSTPDFDR